jgi:membrane AbrB-like protein
MTLVARRAPARAWFALASVTAAGAWLLARVHFPSGTILVALVVGLVTARRLQQRVYVGHRLATAAQALVGVVLGSQVSRSTFTELRGLWLAVALATLASLAISLIVGRTLHGRTRLDAPTATLAIVPGGALGIVTMARELGGDDRLVAFSQYLRVSMLIVVTPLLVTVMGGSGKQTMTDGAHSHHYVLVGSLTAIGIAAIGFAIGRGIRLPTAALLGPLALALIFRLALPDAAITMAAPLREAAFALVGLDVGLRFTPAALRRVRDLLPAFTGAVAALVVAHFGLAIVLNLTTSLTLLDAYLATTPGGLSVVAATAYVSGATTSLVVAIQVVRLVLMLALAPTIVRFAVSAIERGRPR